MPVPAKNSPPPMMPTRAIALVCMMAGRLSGAGIGLQDRSFSPAERCRLRTSRGKGAAGRQIERTWQFARQRNLLPGFLGHRIGHRDRRDQGLRIGMRWMAEDLVGGSVFDDGAKIHDGDLVGDI